MQRQWRAVFTACSIVLLSVAAGCGGGDGGGGGGGNSDGSPATLSASNDTGTVVWNAPATIDVLANDTASIGTLTLVSVTAPAHGQAVIAEGRVVYTPSAGYFGSDTLSYTVRASQGGATATGTLAIDVRARVSLQGTVGGGALAGAQVVVQL
ncbi:MAG TPA: Ig-like domain-containing protein, partial [Rhizobacter sp.]|nr:Ig-like domain-containing protein [Rhizobacter sp.]